MIKYPEKWAFSDQVIDYGVAGARCASTGESQRYLYQVVSGDRHAGVSFDSLLCLAFTVHSGEGALDGNAREEYLTQSRRGFEKDANIRRGVSKLLALKKQGQGQSLNYDTFITALREHHRLSPAQVDLLDRLASQAELTVEPECWPVDLKSKKHQIQILPLLHKNPGLWDRLARHQKTRLQEHKPDA